MIRIWDEELNEVDVIEVENLGIVRQFILHREIALHQMPTIAGSMNVNTYAIIRAYEETA
jgi:hypothetical protein